jgi:hypothetical protein
MNKPLPKVGSQWKHNRTAHDTIYTVLFITNVDHRNSKHPAQVVYQGSNGSYWSRPLATWPETLFPLH